MSYSQSCLLNTTVVLYCTSNVNLHADVHPNCIYPYCISNTNIFLSPLSFSTHQHQFILNQPIRVQKNKTKSSFPSIASITSTEIASSNGSNTKRATTNAPNAAMK